MPSVHFQILEAVQDRIRSLNIFNESSVRLRLIPIDRDFGKDGTYELPALILSPLGQEIMAPATNYRDDVFYPVAVSMFCSSDYSVQDLENQIDQWLTIRERIAKAFRFQRVDVDGVWNCLIEPNAITDPAHFGTSRRVGYMVLKFVSREVRGT
jgi:hypothetical protein